MKKYVSGYISRLNKNMYQKMSQRSFFSDRHLTVQSINNGIVQPPLDPKTRAGKRSNLHDALFGSGGVLDEKNRYVELSAQKAYNMKTRVYGKHDYEAADVKIIHEKVIYLNYFIEQWGHFLLDVVGRLWYALKDKDTKIVYTCYKGQGRKIKGNYKEFLDLLGIGEERLIMVDTETQFDEVIVPESSIMPGEYYTKEYKSIFDTVIKNAGIGPINLAKKIYCSRMRFGKNNKKEFGEEIIEENLTGNGFKPVYMEELPLREQIRLLNSSETIGMTCGSLSHNLIFVRKKNKAFIFNKTYRINMHQFMINEIYSGEATFVDAYVSPLPILYGYGPFIVRATREFVRFMNNQRYSIVNNVRKISLSLKIKYYIRYVISYRKFLLKCKPIRESNKMEFEPSFSIIRKNYKEYLTYSKEARHE